MSVLSPTTVPQEPTTKIKPSEAIRLGRLTRPRPIRGLMFAVDGGACALGAMAVGYGFDAEDLFSLASAIDAQSLLRARGVSDDILLEVIEQNDSSPTPADDRIVAYLERQGL